MLFSITSVSKVLRMKDMNIFTIFYLFFNIIYVVPILFYWISGIPNYGYHLGYNLAIEDKKVALVYNILTLSALVIFYFYIRKKSKYIKAKTISFKIPEIHFKYKNFILLILLMIIILPIIIILLAPRSSVYLSTLGYFSSFYYTPNAIELAYHNNIRPFVFIAFAAFVGIRLLNNSKMLNIYVYPCLLFWLSLENKRTLFAFLILAFAYIDTFKQEPRAKTIIKNFGFAALIIFGYFLLYGVVTGKQAEIVSSFDQMKQYFLRDVDLKLSLYWRNNPDHFHFLDYPGQSLVFDLFRFVPRSIWIDKPWPYDVYATSAAMGNSQFTFYSWNVQVSWIGELVTNLGIIGYFLAIYSYIILDRIAVKTNNLTFSIFIFYVMIRLSMLGFNSTVRELVFLIIFYIIIKFKEKGGNN